MKNWKAHALGIVLGIAVFILASTFVRSDTRSWDRETFEIACWSLEAAVEYASAVDYNRCFVFSEQFGFEPYGFLEEVMTLDTGLTVYYVDWGNGAPGVYAVK